MGGGRKLQFSLRVFRTGRVLVLDHFLGLVRDTLVDLLESPLGSEQVVLFIAAFLRQSLELPGIALSSLVVLEGHLLDDTGVDELLDVLVDGGVAYAGIEFLEFVHRG